MVGNFKSFVIDASYVLSSLFPDEESPEGDQIIKQYLEEAVDLISAPIFNLEVLNGLRSATISKRITSKEADNLALQFLKLGIPLLDGDLYQIFLLAKKKNLSVYDASYVYLARIKRVPLLTLDKKLRKLAG